VVRAPDERSGHEEVDELGRKRRRRLVRAAAALVGLVLVIAFVVENAQPVDVRFWFVSRHPRLIWVVLACLVIGVALGYALAMPRRRKRKAAGQPPRDEDPAR